MIFLQILVRVKGRKNHFIKELSVEKITDTGAREAKQTEPAHQKL